MIRTFKYRIYPNKEKTNKISYSIELCRKLYNIALEQRIFVYKQTHRFISYIDQQNQLPELKESYNDFQLVYAQVLQDVLRRLDKSFKAFFGRIKKHQNPGFPHFKSEDFYNSICYPQSGFKLESNKLFLAKIGFVCVELHRVIAGKIKTCLIIREVDKFYVCFTFEIKDVVKQNKTVETAIGIDLGLQSFATLSTSEKIDNPRWLKKSQRKLTRHQRRLSRRIKKSFNRARQKKRIARIHCKIKNQRNDFLHKLSRQLVDNYDLIAYEDLSIKDMIENGKFAKSISDVSWNRFCQMLQYKAAENGKYALPVSPRNTSQICSKCGEIVQKTLWIRIHKCNKCGLEMDRDENASLNILKLGMDLYRRNYGNSRLGNLLNRVDYEPRSSIL